MSIGGNVYIKKPKLNKFRFTPTKALTCNMGDIVPVFCEQVLPGDIWKLNHSSLLRTMPMLAPLMHRVQMYVHYFFVPFRLIWDNFEQFIINPSSGINMPVVTSPSADGVSGWSTSSLMDYLGYTTGVAGFTQSALMVRGYNKIINDWYLYDFVQSARALSTSDGIDSTTDITIARRCWRPDFFTSALPFAQYSDPTYLPLAEEAPVTGNGKTLGLTDGTTSGGLAAISVNAAAIRQDLYGVDVGTANTATTSLTALKGVGVTTDGSNSGLEADLSNASAITINELRQAIALQVANEITARTGDKYIDFLQGHFGVKSADSRLQRSEYLGGGTSDVFISEIEQTSATISGGTAQGNLSGKGTSYNQGKVFKHRFTEHGVIIGLMSVMPEGRYFQGSRKFFNYRSALDFPLPAYSMLGEQPVYEEEIYAQGDNVTTTVTADDGTTLSVGNKTIFGFQPQSEECRYIPSTVHGDLKGSMKYWTLAREFANPPLLNSSFMTGAPSKRIFAVEDQTYDSLICEFGWNITAYRPLPKQGIPTTFGLLY